MNPSISGFGFLAGYIVMVGVASFLEKFSMKQLNPYQINFRGIAFVGAEVSESKKRDIKFANRKEPCRPAPS